MISSPNIQTEVNNWLQCFILGHQILYDQNRITNCVRTRFDSEVMTITSSLSSLPIHSLIKDPSFVDAVSVMWLSRARVAT